MGSEFTVGKDSFDELTISPTEISGFYYFLHPKIGLIKHFVIDDSLPTRKYFCDVTLIKKGDKFSPRLAVSIRKINGNILKAAVKPTTLTARVGLENCSDNFWNLVSYIKSLDNIEVPQSKFSLIQTEDSELIKTIINKRNPESIRRVIQALAGAEGVNLTEKDVNRMLNRKERLKEFMSALSEKASDESWWQDFFEANKWIFGYGLNYQILRDEQQQPSYGGQRVDGKGNQRGDVLMSTQGDVCFTVLVEIKTPAATLLSGSAEIRAGAWSISKNLTDGVSQLQANMEKWLEEASSPENRDRFEAKNIWTVLPKGIMVIGSQSTLAGVRSKIGTFQRFRRSFHGIDIVTFDELLERAKYIVDHTEVVELNSEPTAIPVVEPPLGVEINLDNIPF